MAGPHRFQHGIPMRTAIFILILLASSQVIANESKNCFGEHKYDDFKFLVMKESYFGLLFGYGSEHPPSSEDLIWSFPEPSNNWNYDYRAKEFSEFLRTLSPLRHLSGSKWNAMSASYRSDGKYACVLSIKMDVKKIQRNFRAVALDDFIIYINGEPYASIMNPYYFFMMG